MVNAIAVVGAGTMGAGIAQLAASHGCAVHLIDVSQEVLQRGVEDICKQFDRLVGKGKMPAAERDAAVDRIMPSDGIRELGNVELAIEAVVEDLATKRKVFEQLDRATASDAVLATNTSSLSVSKIAEAVRDSSRVVGMHFFNPAPIMPLVEIIAGKQSRETALERATQAATLWGKTTVRAKDTPGFIVNRVARGFYLEALRLLGEGAAGVDEIDVVLRKHAGFKMGPFELMDLIGLDVNLAVSTSVWEQLGKPARLAPHEIQRQLVAKGHLGRKSGRGFYTYDGATLIPAYAVDRRSFLLNPLLSDAMQQFARRAGAADAATTEQYILCRLLSAIMLEAAICESEGVATREDIDIAMVKGTNYPKGPLAWAGEIGLRTVRGVLKALNQAVTDGRFEAGALFQE
jgi:3-hydroxybutyryl-CoA dehydrogenase